MPAKSTQKKRPKSWRKGQPVYDGCPCALSCCDKAAPCKHEYLAHERGEFPRDDSHGESLWWVECWSCGAVCTCEV